MHRLENLVSFVRRESSRNSIDEKFACRDAPSSRNDRMRANSRVRATMILDRIDAEITTVVAFGNINLIYALVESGVRLERAWVICKASKYRNCYRKQFYGRCALYGSEGREYCGELFRRQSSSISYGLNLIAPGRISAVYFFRPRSRTNARDSRLTIYVWHFSDSDNNNNKQRFWGSDCRFRYCESAVRDVSWWTYSQRRDWFPGLKSSSVTGN